MFERSWKDSNKDLLKGGISDHTMMFHRDARDMR